MADTILAAFDAYHAEFQGMTRRARGRFARGEWAEARRDSARRLGLYRQRVHRMVTALDAALEDAEAGAEFWQRVKHRFAPSAAARADGEVAATFYNSVVRRVGSNAVTDHATLFIDPVEAADDGGDGVHGVGRIERWPGPINAGALEHALRSFDLGAPWVDLAEDARLGAAAIEAQLRQAGLGSAGALEFLPAPFYRNKGAYLVGRLVGGAAPVPLLLPVVREGTGIRLDAVLTEEDEVSVVFGFTRSYFHAELPAPRAAIAFLRSIMPRKRLDELYTGIGYNKHGKTELYHAVVRQLEAGARFQRSAGDRGMVMAVFALPELNVVVKVIKDRFDFPKRTTRQQVMAKYDLVFSHDRVGRLADAQEFAALEFRREHFEPELLDELLEVAPSVVRWERDRVHLAHAYTERQVAPLNLFLRDADSTAARDALVDYGNAIKELAAANIFPGDMLLKNFGVTRHGRVIFYDYDELSLLTDCRFRRIPPPRDDADEMSAEPWFHVADGDVFPEEFGNFVTLPGVLGTAFLAEHADLFDVEFWQGMQRRQAEGEIVDFYPYRSARRLRHGDAT